MTTEELREKIKRLGMMFRNDCVYQDNHIVGGVAREAVGVLFTNQPRSEEFAPTYKKVASLLTEYSFTPINEREPKPTSMSFQEFLESDYDELRLITTDKWGEEFKGSDWYFQEFEQLDTFLDNLENHLFSTELKEALKTGVFEVRRGKEDTEGDSPKGVFRTR